MGIAPGIPEREFYVQTRDQPNWVAIPHVPLAGTEQCCKVHAVSPWETTWNSTVRSRLQDYMTEAEYRNIINEFNAITNRLPGECATCMASILILPIICLQCYVAGDIEIVQRELQAAARRLSANSQVKWIFYLVLQQSGESQRTAIEAFAEVPSSKPEGYIPRASQNPQQLSGGHHSGHEGAHTPLLAQSKPPAYNPAAVASSSLSASEFVFCPKCGSKRPESLQSADTPFCLKCGFKFPSA